MPRRIALYARVSTTDQHPEIQLHGLRQYAEARGFAVAGSMSTTGSAVLATAAPPSTDSWPTPAAGASM
jgi:hypothetical protein